MRDVDVDVDVKQLRGRQAQAAADKPARPGGAVDLQRRAGNRRLAAALAPTPGRSRTVARAKIDYVPNRSKMGERIKKSTSSMTEAELQDVVDHPHAPYTRTEVEAAQRTLDERKRVAAAAASGAKPKPKGKAKTPAPAATPVSDTDLSDAEARLAAIVDATDARATAAVDKFNDSSTGDSELDALFVEIKAIYAGVYGAIMGADRRGLNPAAVELVKADLSSRTRAAQTRAGEIIKDRGRRAVLIGERPVPYPGSKLCPRVDHSAPTADSTAAVSRAGLQALKKLGFADGDLHHAFNALTQGYAKSHDGPVRRERFLLLLDEMEPLWVHVKPRSAVTWLRKALLPAGSDLHAHFKGAYAELHETHRILHGGLFLPGTLITMGKDKARPLAPGMKSDAPATQDVDISFHGADKRRHYHEVKADPDTIVNKIGGGEHKSSPVPAPHDPSLATTPDQVLSYESTARAHAAKGAGKRGLYASGKQIVLVYVAPRTTNWLRIFTTSAARRLVKHGFELHLGSVEFDAELLRRIQVRVDHDTLGVHDKDDWARTMSGSGQPYEHPSAFLATLRGA